MTDFLEHHNGSPICVVAFASSGANKNGEPVFEWKRTLDSLGVSYILLRDSADRWYQDGVKGIGGQEAVSDFIRRECWIKNRYERIIHLGLSSGAYAALLFEHLAMSGSAIAISPVTVLGGEAADSFPPQYAHRLKLPPQLSAPIDLRCPDPTGYGPWSSRKGVRAFVSDGEGAELDARMCELIGITPTLIPGQSHAGLARHMVDTGLVQKLIMGEA